MALASLFDLCCQIAGGESYLQVVASGVCVQIDDLSCEVEVVDEFGLHTLAVNLASADSTLGDDGLLKTVVAADVERQVFKEIYNQVMG